MTDKNTTEQDQQEAVEAPETAQDAQEQPQDAPEAQDDAQEATEQQGDAQDARTPNAEARKYRLRLRETEAALTEAQEQVQQLQDQLMQDALSGDFHLIPSSGNRAVDGSGDPKAQPFRLRNAGDLFTVGGVTRADMFGDDGQLDTVRLTAAVQKLHQQRPELFRARTGAVPTLGKVPEAHTPARTWAHVLSGD